ncbi:unnamed protein product, partial [Pylaiella littoralis]
VRTPKKDERAAPRGRLFLEGRNLPVESAHRSQPSHREPKESDVRINNNNIVCTYSVPGIIKLCFETQSFFCGVSRSFASQYTYCYVDNDLAQQCCPICTAVQQFRPLLFLCLAFV